MGEGHPLRAVFLGLVPDWTSTAVGRHVVEGVVARAPAGGGAGHPNGWCGALYCPSRLSPTAC